jgi:hypothetical protein
MSPCHHVTISTCHHFTTSPCHHVTISTCNHFNMSPFHHVTMSPCQHVNMMLTCHCSSLLFVSCKRPDERTVNSVETCGLEFYWEYNLCAAEVLLIVNQLSIAERDVFCWDKPLCLFIILGSLLLVHLGSLSLSVTLTQRHSHLASHSLKVTLT